MIRPAIAWPGARVLITGAGSGIGAATAEACAARGATVLAVDIDAEAAQATADRLGGAAAAYPVDVADGRAVAELAARVTGEHGPLDVLVNNAGVGMSGRFLDMSPDDWEWIVGINLLGVVHGCRSFGPAMVERGRGQVVNLSSGLAYMPRATEPGYVTTKAAVLAFSQCLRADWGSHGVGVSAVCPGIIATSIISRTRFRGSRADPAAVGRVEGTFAKGHPPALVARAIVAAVDHDRPVVPVGWEAWLGWGLQGLLPSRLVGVVARASPGGV
jgi:2-hydroxycyclohexanecarboxyl-CoA dehydrogenase